MLAAQIQPNAAIGWTEMPSPLLPNQGAILRVLGCGVCGSDLDKIRHHKVQPGSVLGHEVVGILETLADNHTSFFSEGDRLVVAHHVPCGTCHYCINQSPSMCRQFKSTNFSPGGFAQKIALSGDHLTHTAFKVPAEISSQAASCVEPLACVLRAIERGGHYQNGSALIVGLGFIGAMAAQVYQSQGYTVLGVDQLSQRTEIATNQQFLTQGFTLPQDEALLHQVKQKKLFAEGVDVVFLSVVNLATWTLALETVRDGGTIVLFSSPNTPKPFIDPTPLYFREIRIISSYSPSLESLQQSARLIFNQQIKVDGLVSHSIHYTELTHGIELYRTGQAMKVFIDFTTLEKRPDAS